LDNYFSFPNGVSAFFKQPVQPSAASQHTLRSVFFSLILNGVRVERKANFYSKIILLLFYKKGYFMWRAVKRATFPPDN